MNTVLLRKAQAMPRPVTYGLGDRVRFTPHRGNRKTGRGIVAGTGARGYWIIQCSDGSKAALSEANMEIEP